MPYVVLIADNEMDSGLLMLKNMATREQEALALEAVVARLRG